MGWCAGMAVACAGMRSGGVSRLNGGRSTAGLTEGESTTLVTENKDRMGDAGGKWVGAVCRYWRAIRWHTQESMSGMSHMLTCEYSAARTLPRNLLTAHC